MSDIVIELRGWPGSPARAIHTMMKAADEITRLRAENARLKSTDMAVAMAEMSLRDEIVRLRARVAMLERVMQEIADFCEEGDRRTFVAIANTVRAALEVKP